MKKTLFAALAFVMMVGVAIVLPLSTAHAVSSFVVETETKIYKPAKSFGGYFMPTNNSAGATHWLMDMMGNVVHQWDGVTGVGNKQTPGLPGITPVIAEDGTLWSGGYIQDWDGNVLWDFVPSRDLGIADANMPFHHESRRIWNKKLNQWTQLIVSNRARTQAEAAAAGGDPTTPLTRLTGIDYIIEVGMNKKIVWQWDFMDHTVQSQYPSRPRYISDVKNAPGKFDVYWLTDNQQPRGQAGFVADWVHVNSVDYNDETGHVVINPKHFSQFIVVDHDTTFISTTDFTKNIAAAAGGAGDIIYRWHNPASYNAGAAPGWLSEGDQQGYGYHNIQYIRPYHWARPKLPTDNWPDPATYTASGVSMPGAGNFLIFDNGCYNPTRTGSRTIEINPRIGASGTQEVGPGQFVNPLVAGYKAATGNYQRRISQQTVWSYQSTGMHAFYSSHISGMQRLPNGNTSINSGNQGLMFEVTPTNEIVWQYQYPMAAIGAGGPLGAKLVASDSANAYQTDDNYNRGQPSIFRHTRYGADYPGLAGKDLTPTGTLTGLEPRLIGEGRTTQTPKYGFGFGSAFSGGGGGSGGASGGGGGGY
ncbi:MAG: aryl-sulfate sulfotransferase [Deltaproteobacteria bacterium]